MPGCSAVDCSNRTEQGYILKAFPRNPELRAIWTSKVKRVNWKPTNYSFLCEVHFDDDQWEKKEPDSKRKLKKTAIPTLFSFAPAQKKRKAPQERNIVCKKPNVEVSRSDEKDAVIAHLKENLEKANEKLMLYEENLKILKEKVKELSIENSRLKNENIEMKNKSFFSDDQELIFNDDQEPIFNDDQILALKRKSMSYVKWSNKTVETALGLRFVCGTKGYETLLGLRLPYPSIRTLQRRLENLKFNSGILSEIFEFLKVKVATFNEHEKECVLLLDEMSITEGIDYDTSNSTYVGDVTFPGSEGRANQALVFMIGGISSRWKQVVAYYFTNGKINREELKNTTLNIIKNVEDVGLRISSITSDMGSMNQSMWKAFGIDCGCSSLDKYYIVHPHDPKRTISFLADVPHLLKNIRTSLFSNKHFIIPEITQKTHNLPSNVISSHHLNLLIEYQEGMDLKPAPKLTEQHTHENHFNKMKVNRAKHVISRDVSSGLKYFSQDTGNKDVLTTAWFIETIDKWFTLMTSRHPVNALSKSKTEKYNETLLFLKDIIHLFKNIKIVNNNGKIAWKPIQTGVIISTLSILKLQEKFLNELKFNFLLTSRFTQDSLESLFSIVRSKQPQPTALQFKNNLKLISVSQYLKQNSKSNYEHDDREFLPNFLDILKETPKIHKIVLPFSWDKTCNAPLKLAEQNCLYYIAGYIVSRIMILDKICDSCLSSVGSKEQNNEMYAKLVSLKEYRNGCLFYVNGDAFSYFLRCETIFRSLENFLLKEKSNCKSFIIKNINSDSTIKNINFRSCHNIKEKIQKRFVNFRLKIFSLKKTKENSSNKKKIQSSSKFSSKSMKVNF